MTTRFRRIDANRFEAVIYGDGKAVAPCAIELSQERHFSPGIRYGADLDRGFNESLQVTADDQALYLSSYGMFGGGREQKLTVRGGADLYWDKFIEPLQQR